MEQDNSDFNNKNCILNRNMLKKRSFENANDGCVNYTEDSKKVVTDPASPFHYERITDAAYNSHVSSTMSDHSFDNDTGKRRKLMINGEIKTDSSNEKGNIVSYLSNVDVSNDMLNSNIHNLASEEFPSTFAEMSSYCGSTQGTTCTSTVSSNWNYMKNNDRISCIPNESDSFTQRFTPVAEMPICLNISPQKKEGLNDKEEMKEASRNITSVKNSINANNVNVKNDDLTFFQEVLKTKALGKKCKHFALHNTRLRIDDMGQIHCSLNSFSKKKHKVFCNLSRQVISNLEEGGTVKISVYNDTLFNNEEDNSESECDNCITMKNYMSGIHDASQLQAYKNNTQIVEDKSKEFGESKYNVPDNWTSSENYYDSNNANVYQSPQDSQNTQEHQRNQHTQSTQSTQSTQGTQTNGRDSQNSQEFLNSNNRNHHNSFFHASTDGSYMQGDVQNTHLLNGIHHDPRNRNDRNCVQEQQNSSHNRHSSRHIDFVNFHDFANMRRTHADHPYIFGDEDVYGHQPYGIDEQSQMPEMEALTSFGAQNQWNAASAVRDGLVHNVGSRLVSVGVNTVDTATGEDLNMENHVEMNGNVEYFCPTFPYDTNNQQSRDDAEESNIYPSYQNRRNSNNRNRRS